MKQRTPGTMGLDASLLSEHSLYYEPTDREAESWGQLMQFFRKRSKSGLLALRGRRVQVHYKSRLNQGARIPLDRGVLLGFTYLEEPYSSHVAVVQPDGGALIQLVHFSYVTLVSDERGNHASRTTKSRKAAGATESEHVQVRKVQRRTAKKTRRGAKKK